jgi:hypothetical protein
MCARTACKYGAKNIAFHVNEGSTPFWLSLLIEFEDGEGDIGSMQLKQVPIFFFLFRLPSFASLCASVHCLFVLPLARSTSTTEIWVIFCPVGTG